MANNHRVFVTGGTGYIGSRLIATLHSRGHDVLALTRETSRNKLPWSCTPVSGDALDGESYRRFVNGCDTFIQLVGVPHPSPAKAAQFRQIDRKAGLEAISVARQADVRHFIYVSVAQPAPLMQAYLDVRAECERAIEASGLAATVLRPWYVLGPGHWWPYCVMPFYKIAELLPRTRAGALRLGFVTIRQMIHALANAVDQPHDGIRVLSVPDIRALGGREKKVPNSFSSR